MDYWYYYSLLKDVHHAIDYRKTSQLYGFYEGPITTILWHSYPFLHIGLALFLLYYILTIYSSKDAYEKYVGVPKGVAALVLATVGLACYLLPGTIAGSHWQTVGELQRAYPNAIPAVLPPAPLPHVPPGAIIFPNFAARGYVTGERSQYNVPVALGQQVKEISVSTGAFLTALDFLIMLTPLLIVFVVTFLRRMPQFLFARSYRRISAQPHLPTEIVDQALRGKRIDHQTLARAMTSSTAPIQADTLADRVERERLHKLAERLRTDAAALQQKLGQEAEIARLVVDHARKREELADMEKKLRDMGVRRHG